MVAAAVTGGALLEVRETDVAEVILGKRWQGAAARTPQQRGKRKAPSFKVCTPKGSRTKPRVAGRGQRRYDAAVLLQINATKPVR